MPVRIEFAAEPIDVALDRARDQLTDMTPLFQDIAEYMVKSTRDRFLTGTAPDGQRWAAKKPATIAAYLRRGDGNRPNPLIGPSERLGREIAGLATRSSAEIGSSLEYSGTMQEGAAKGAFGATRTGRPVPGATSPPGRSWGSATMTSATSST